MKRQMITYALLITIAVGSLVGLGSQPAQAAQFTTTFTVNTQLDPGDGVCDTAECTLHEAVTQANAIPGSDLIVFASWPLTITLNQPLPAFTDSVTIDGSGLADGRVTISGNNQFRVLDIAPNVTVRLQNVVIADGVAHRDAVDMELERGGGIRNAGTLYIDSSIIQDNHADAGGGVGNTGLLIIKNHSTFIRNTANDGAAGGNGGAIFNAHKVNISSSSIGGTVPVDRNTAVGYGGGLYNAPGGYGRVEKSTNFAFNRAWRGGGLANASGSELTITNATFYHNGGTFGASQESGGAIWNQSSAVLNIDQSSFTNNFAYYRGGAILNEGYLTVNNTAFHGDSVLDMGGAIFNGGSVSITDCTFERHESWNYAGVILNGGPMFIQRSTFTDNYSWDGSVILNWGDLHISGSTFSGNVNDFSGVISNSGDLEVTNSTFHHNASEYGAAILNQYDGQAVISHSTFSDNEAQYGGAIANQGEAILWVTNSTLTRNTVVGSTWRDGQGGAIYNESSAYVAYSTISGNMAEVGGGLFNYHSSYLQGTTWLFGTIVAHNQATISGGDCSEPVASMNYNLDSDGSCGLDGEGDLTAVPLLGPLQNNGGSTETMALLPGSPAIDAVPAGVCSQSDDQRGVIRPQDGNGDGTPACDMGAYELNPD